MEKDTKKSMSFVHTCATVRGEMLKLYENYNHPGHSLITIPLELLVSMVDQAEKGARRFHMTGKEGFSNFGGDYSFSGSMFMLLLNISSVWGK
jgi:hypothetical protein